MTRVQIDEGRIDAIFAPFNDFHTSGVAIPGSSLDLLSFYRGKDIDYQHSRRRDDYLGH